MNSHMQSQELPELPVVDLLLRWRRVPAVPAEDDEAVAGGELLLRRRAAAEALRLVLLLLLLLPVPRGVRRVLRRRVLRAVPALLVRLRLPAVLLLVVVRLPQLRRRRVLRPALLPVPMMTIGEERLIEHISFFFWLHARVLLLDRSMLLPPRMMNGDDGF
jgi:hypothetical protein